MSTLKNLTMLAAVAGLAFATTSADVVVTAQSAGTVDPGLYNGMRWRSIGPARGGRSIATAGSDARPNEY